MPIYEYKCEKCKKVFEVLQSKNIQKEKCPSCGGTGRKILSSVGFVFKGSGFYVNDYKNKSSSSSSAPAKNEKPAEKKAEPAAPAPAPAPAKPGRKEAKK